MNNLLTEWKDEKTDEKLKTNLTNYQAGAENFRMVDIEILNIRVEPVETQD